MLVSGGRRGERREEEGREDEKEIREKEKREKEPVVMDFSFLSNSDGVKAAWREEENKTKRNYKN